MSLTPRKNKGLLTYIAIAAVIIILYVYVSTYISAGKVKKVSVTELMTE